MKTSEVSYDFGIHYLVDAEPVGHGGDGAERPAAAAAALVADLLDAGALRPLAPRVELGGDLRQKPCKAFDLRHKVFALSLSLSPSQKVRLPQRRHELLVHRVDAEQGLLSGIKGEVSYKFKY